MSCNKNNLKLLVSIGGISLTFAGYKVFKLIMRENRRKQLKDQVVVITGASSGIGKAYAIAFAREKAKVVLAARSTDKIETLAEELKTKYNIETLAVTTDVSKEADAQNLIEQTLERFGHIDILINNAGIMTYGYFYENNIEELKEIMDVNYWGTLYCTQSAIPHMIKRGKGKIVNVSSFLGKRSLPVVAGYSASKFAVNGFSESLRVELKKFGIDVVVICPSNTRTELTNNALNTDNVKIPSNMGMTADRVAKETINAILDGKREHVLGIGENLLLSLNNNFPLLVDKAMAFAPRFMLDE